MIQIVLDVARRPFLTVLCIVFFAVPLVAEAASAMKLSEYIEKNGGKDVRSTGATLFLFDLVVIDDTNPANPMESSSRYFYKGKMITKDEYGSPVSDMIEISDDYPRPGLKTIVIPSHGGMTAYGWSCHVFIFSNNSLQHTLFDTAFVGADTVISGNGLLDITHHSMNCPLGIKDGLGISFYTAVHPRYTRYYIYKDGEWRHSKIGELKEEYDALFSRASTINLQEQSTGDQNLDADVAGAILAEETYYCIMSGKSDSICKSNLKNRLPKELKWITDSLFETVKEDVVTFNDQIETKIYR